MSFDALAPHYRWMEFILAGSKLQRCRTHFLGAVSHCRSVLSVGEGNGRFLLACQGSLPQARITCVDASARMLTLARQRLGKVERKSAPIEFIEADALVWQPPECAFDLVVTHFFLDCFPADQLQHVVRNLAKAATPHANWLVADFRVPPAAGVGRYRALLIHRLMYQFFRLTTRLPAKRLTTPDASFEAHGFTLRERRLFEWGLLHTDWWERNGAE